MLETLKKKAKKCYMIRAVICFAVAIGLLVWTKFAIFSMITGPKEIDITADPESYNGKYVTTDIDFFLTDYVEHATTTTYKYGGSSTSVNGNSYIVFQSVDDYENETSTWYFYSLYMNKADQSKMYGLIDDTWEYLQDETGTVAPPSPLNVKGSWMRLDSEMEGYFTETMADMGLEETEYDRFYLYSLDTSKIGGVTIPMFWLMNGAALILILCAVYSVIGFFGNGYAKEIHKYLQDNSAVSLSAVDADFTQAHPIGKDTWIGRKWTVYIRGTKASILANKDLMWGYYYRRTGRNSVSEMRLYRADGRVFHVSMSEDNTKTALQYYASEQPQMIIGYSADLEQTYRNNFVGFKDLKYNPAMAASEEEANRF